MRHRQGEVWGTSSHQANAKLAQIIKEKGISGGGLKLYCKTRWTTASES
ncbi:21309_t:CDS:2, partial [Rhizophagus irregularis]